MAYDLSYIEEQIGLLDTEISNKYDIMNTYTGNAPWVKQARTSLYNEIQGLKSTRQTWYDAKHETEKEERDSNRSGRNGRTERAGRYGPNSFGSGR